MSLVTGGCGRPWRRGMFAALFTAALMSPALVSAGPLMEALAKGTPSLRLRLSGEYSDLDGNDTRPAKGLILLTRVGFTSAPAFKTTLHLAFQAVASPLEDYRPEKAEYDVIADVEGAGVHEAFLQSRLSETMSLRLGRQEITLDDHRLIGNIGWRQHSQSFDALRFDARFGDRVGLSVGYANRVKTIFNTLVWLDYLALVHATAKLGEHHNLSAFAYFLDTPGGGPTDRDSATYGVRVTGAVSFLDYRADAALQTKWADAEQDRGQMFNVNAGAKVGPLRVGLGYSSLSGATASDRAFDTLFSTAHKFNGWSDQFLGTNGGKLSRGLIDTYGEIGAKVVGVKILGRYHIFRQESQSQAYGSEVDVLVAKKFTDHLSGLAKAAFYSADTENESGVAAADETVAWLRLEVKY